MQHVSRPGAAGILPCGREIGKVGRRAHDLIAHDHFVQQGVVGGQGTDHEPLAALQFGINRQQHQRVFDPVALDDDTLRLRIDEFQVFLRQFKTLLVFAGLVQERKLQHTPQQTRCC